MAWLCIKASSLSEAPKLLHLPRLKSLVGDFWLADAAVAASLARFWNELLLRPGAVGKEKGCFPA